MEIKTVQLARHPRAKLKCMIEKSANGSLKPAMIVIPGGSYLYKGHREGDPVAVSFVARNYQAFVLDYATLWDEDYSKTGNPIQINDLTSWPEQVEELLEAIAWIRQNHKELMVDPEKIYCCGFSAGGHLAAASGVYWKKVDPFLCGAQSPKDLRPDGLVLCYPLLSSQLIKYFIENPNEKYRVLGVYVLRSIFGSLEISDEQWADFNIAGQVDKEMPPTFLWHTGDDELTDPKETLLFTHSLLKHHVTCELHLFESGKHGAALANSLTAKTAEDDRLANSMWLELADLFLKNIEAKK